MPLLRAGGGPPDQGPALSTCSYWAGPMAVDAPGPLQLRSVGPLRVVGHQGQQRAGPTSDLQDVAAAHPHVLSSHGTREVSSSVPASRKPAVGNKPRVCYGLNRVPKHPHAEVLTAALQNNTIWKWCTHWRRMTLTQGLPSWLRGDFGHRGRWVEGPGRNGPSGGREVIPGPWGRPWTRRYPASRSVSRTPSSVSVPDCDRVTPPGDAQAVPALLGVWMDKWPCVNQGCPSVHRALRS